MHTETSKQIRRRGTGIIADRTFSAQVRLQLRDRGTHSQRPHDRLQLPHIRNLAGRTGVEVEAVAELVNVLFAKVTSHPPRCLRGWVLVE